MLKNVPLSLRLFPGPLYSILSRFSFTGLAIMQWSSIIFRSRPSHDKRPTLFTPIGVCMSDLPSNRYLKSLCNGILNWSARRPMPWKLLPIWRISALDASSFREKDRMPINNRSMGLVSETDLVRKVMANRSGRRYHFRFSVHVEPIANDCRPSVHA